MFILKAPDSTIFNVPPPSNSTQWDELLDETTLTDHSVFYMHLGIKDGDYFRNIEERLHIRVYDDGLESSLASASLHSSMIRLTIVKEPTLLVKRFYPFNVMHILHDDFLGYAEQWTAWSLDREPQARLVVYDHHHANAHDQIYNWLGPKMQRIDQIMGWPHWVSSDNLRRKEFICFKDAIIGSTKDQAWYQYGFTEPQGPLPNFTVTGWRIREITKEVLQRLGSFLWYPDRQARIVKELVARGTCENKGDRVISIFSRKLNRLILNEETLAKSLELSFGLPVIFLRMEEMSLNSIAKHMSRTIIAFGMHGSLLAMAMFMPPGAVLIEGYPFGVPAENYTPYRTMCKLPGMRITYRAWSCSNRDDSIGHPKRTADKGGIVHLTEEEQKEILESSTIKPHLCCTDPHWLYRIYQDTSVNADEVIYLIRDALSETYNMYNNIVKEI